MQFVTVRVEAVGVVPKATIPALSSSGRSMTRALIDERSVYLAEAGGSTTCPVFDRSLLEPGVQLRGGAIVEQMDATTLLLPDSTATIDDYGNLIIKV
jgi:N-methylhydantoinase A